MQTYSTWKETCHQYRLGTAVGRPLHQLHTLCTKSDIVPVVQFQSRRARPRIAYQKFVPTPLALHLLPYSVGNISNILRVPRVVFIFISFISFSIYKH